MLIIISLLVFIFIKPSVNEFAVRTDCPTKTTEKLKPYCIEVFYDINGLKYSQFQSIMGECALSQFCTRFYDIGKKML